MKCFICKKKESEIIIYKKEICSDCYDKYSPSKLEKKLNYKKIIQLELV